MERFDERIVGDSRFVEWLRGQGRLKERLPKRASAGEILRKVAEAFAIPEDLIRTGKKRTSLTEARAVFSCLAINECGHKGTEIGQILGINRSGISLLMR
jgi:chromosomal replication initiation ATPase DnaA